MGPKLCLYAMKNGDVKILGKLYNKRYRRNLGFGQVVEVILDHKEGYIVWKIDGIE